MKKIKLLIATLALCFLIPCFSAQAAAMVTEEGSAQKGILTETAEGKYRYLVNGIVQRSKWKLLTVNGKQEKYYFKENGDAAAYSYEINGKLYVFNTVGQLQRSSTGKWQIVNVDKNTYYVNKYGRASTGWLIINNRLYCTDSKGRFLKNAEREGVQFSNTGKAKVNTASELKIKTIQIVNSITNENMSKEQKLRAVWDYVANSGNFYYALDYPNVNKKGWQRDCALLMLRTGRGNCYGFACTFAALARTVGYNPYLVCGRVPGSRDGAADGMTRHCWNKIAGYYYDPEGQYVGSFLAVYHGAYYPSAHTIQKIVNYAKE